MEISFSYIIKFIALIYGLSLAHSLSCIAEYIQNWKKIKHYWVWWIWAIYLICLSAGFWITIYAYYGTREVWVIGHFFFLTFQSALFYLTYYIFFNRFHELENNDLELEYYKYKKIFFLLLAIQFLMMFIGHTILATNFSLAVILRYNIFPLIYSIIFISLAFLNNKIIHKTFAVFFLLTFIVLIIVS